MSGLINDKNTPAELPQNEFTEMIEAVRARNQRGGSLTAAEVAEGVPVTGTPMPTVRSADLGRSPVRHVVPAALESSTLSPEESAELDRMALESGMVRGPVTPGIAALLESGADTPYGSLEDAIAAGAPIGADPEAVAEGAARFREPEPVHRPNPNRMSAREFIRAPQTTAREFVGAQLPRLPDFKKVQMIDCVNGKVYVDGLEFSLDASELKMLRKFCVTKAKEQIQRSLDAALAALAEDAGDGGAAV